MMGRKPHLGRDVVGRWCDGYPMLAKKRAMSPVGQKQKIAIEADYCRFAA
jgi:hypothetical protein